MSRTAWWGVPTENTLDRATAMFPELLYQRLDELGIDFALLYPTYGLTVTAFPDDELRRAMARAFNRYYAEVYADYRDRLEPVACIPTFTPEEAVEELEYAVGELGLKAVMLAGVVPRRLPGLEEHRAARWIDAIGHDSPYDYDPVWAACDRLGRGSHVPRQRAGVGHPDVDDQLRLQPHRQLRGRRRGHRPVPVLRRRAPPLPRTCASPSKKGGVAWACNLFSDILGHYAKRNRDAIGALRPEPRSIPTS